MPGPISSAIRVIHERDPAEMIWEEVGEFVPQFRVGGPDILIGVYNRRNGKGPNREARSAGGILLPERVADEDNYQGITGLVLKLGPKAYCTEKTEGWFADHGAPKPPEVGDWVMFDIKNGFQFKMGGWTCRLIQDEYIMGVLGFTPDVVA